MRVRTLSLPTVAIVGLALLSFAEARAHADPNSVDLYSPGLSSGDFAGVKQTSAHHPHDWPPTPQERNEIFSTIPGLPKAVQAYDEMRKDALFMRAAQPREISEASLRKAFPGVSLSMFKSLSKRLRR
jgi:hypothetical protein